jgi:hypothetical protein
MGDSAWQCAGSYSRGRLRFRGNGRDLGRDESVSTVAAPTLQLLAWIAERPRTYPETIEVWKSSCPRLTVWEDALSDGLVRVGRGQVLLTAAGTAELQAEETAGEPD